MIVSCPVLSYVASLKVWSLYIVRAGVVDSLIPYMS